MSIDIGELLDVEDAAEPRTVIQQNMEVLARRIWKREGTYQNGSETTLIGPPTSGDRVLKEHWIDSLGGEFVCTVAGTPGTWKQTRPAVTNGEPGSGTIPTGYRIWDADDGFKLKEHAGSYTWLDVQSSLVFDSSNYWTDTIQSDGGRVSEGYGSDADWLIDFTNSTDGKLFIQGVGDSDSTEWLRALNSSGDMVLAATNNGRVDQRAYGADGAIHVLRIVPTTAANDQRAGHYAFGAEDDNGQEHTICRMHSYIRDITNTAIESEWRVDIMVDVDGSGGYSLPNTALIFNKTALSLPDIPLKAAMGLLQLGTSGNGVSIQQAWASATGAGIFQSLGGDSFFGDEANTARAVRFRRNAATIGGFSSTNGAFSLFGGTAAQNHLVLDSAGNWLSNQFATPTSLAKGIVLATGTAPTGTVAAGSIALWFDGSNLRGRIGTTNYTFTKT